MSGNNMTVNNLREGQLFRLKNDAGVDASMVPGGTTLRITTLTRRKIRKNGSVILTDQIRYIGFSLNGSTLELNLSPEKFRQKFLPIIEEIKGNDNSDTSAE